MKRFAALAALAALLATPALAGEEARDAASMPSVSAPAEKAPVRRLSTNERWRGGPYARAGSYNDLILRREALDKTLPIVTNAPNLSLGGGL